MDKRKYFERKKLTLTLIHPEDKWLKPIYGMKNVREN